MYANWLSSLCIGFTSVFARAFCISNFALHSVGMTNQRQHMQKTQHQVQYQRGVSTHSRGQNGSSDYKVP